MIGKKLSAAYKMINAEKRGEERAVGVPNLHRAAGACRCIKLVVARTPGEIVDEAAVVRCVVQVQLNVCAY